MKTYRPRSFALLLFLSGLLLGPAPGRAADLPNAWQIADNSTASGILNYTNTLTAAQQVAATNNGWHFTVVSRLVAGSSNTAAAQLMIYGNGVRRFYAAWDTNAAGQLTAVLGGSPSTTNVLASGAAVTNYHRHELVYDPVTANGTYLFDGTPIRTWSGEVQAAQNGMALWGAGASAFKGTMNYHQVQFAISGLGTVSEYHAGFAGSPVVAPSPTNQGWGLTWSAPSTTLTNFPVSPDVVALPPGFTLTPIAGLPDVRSSSVAWGDYDNDGRVDFLLTGFGAGGVVQQSQLWRNTPTGFSNVTSQVAAGLPGVTQSSVAWGDYDNDGRLDFLLTGYNGSTPITQLWRNTPTGFSNVTSQVAAGLPGVSHSSVAWGDYDNDGRLDFLLTDYNGSTPIAQLWRNTPTGFSNVTSQVIAGLPGVYGSSVAWGDYDNDGRLDFLFTGSTNGLSSGVVSQLWRNTGSGFSNVTSQVAGGLPGVHSGSVAWGDYDNDGRLDFLLTGYNATSLSQLWRNTPTGFSNVTSQVAVGLRGVDQSSVAWGDFDNDGRLDFLLTGRQFTVGLFSQLWRNTGNGFSNVTSQIADGLPGVGYSSVAWGDYDNDGRLDFLLTGATNNANLASVVSQLWRNSFSASNSPPSAPTGLASVAHSANSVTLSWNPALDAQTPTNGLTYNLVLGTSANAVNLASPHANVANGFRRVVRLGAVNDGTNATLAYTFTNLPYAAQYFWSVHAIDTAFAGGPFATAKTFSLPVLAPVANGQSVTATANTAKAITLTASDPNSPPFPLTYSVVQNPIHGTLSGTAPNLTYTPNAPYSGPDSFTFRVNNGVLYSQIATVSITVLASPNMAVLGNSTVIPDGDVTPRVADGTDFGSQSIASGTVVRTFTITNSGSAVLNVTNITLSGAQVADFAVGGLALPAAIAVNSSTNFTVAFSPGAIGLRSATLNIVNNDPTKNPYNFVLQGTGTTNGSSVDAYRLAVLAEPGLVGFYPVDGDTAPLLTDRRLPAQNGTNVSGAGIVSGPGTVGTHSFNGGGGRAALGVVPEYAFTNGVGTVEAFLYQTNISAGNPCLFSVRGTGGTRYSLHGNGGGTNVLYVYNGASAPAFRGPLNMLNQRVHAAFVFTNGTVTVYFNGQSLGTSNLALGNGANQPCQIGAADAFNFEPWLGRIDELAIYTNAQSAAAISARAAALPPNTPPSFTCGTNVASRADSGPVNLPNWATQILPYTPLTPVVYATTFDTQPPGSTLSGNARLDGGILHLTDALNGQNGYFATPVVAAPVESFTATFKVRVGGGTCCGGPTPDGTSRPADGWSLSFGNDIPSTVQGEEGGGTGLIVSFDIWDNGGLDDQYTAPNVDIKVTNNVIAYQAFDGDREGGRAPSGPFITDPATGLPMTSPTGTNFVPVRVHLDADGTLDVDFKSVRVINHVQTGYQPLGGTWLVFGARTGGANENYWIDDLQVESVVSGPPPGEAGQTVSFTVTTDRPELFLAQPAVSPDGTLTYTPAPAGHGLARVTVVARDNGGTAGGGNDTSQPCFFTVTLCATNIVVTSADDSGPGSLRAAITSICPGGTITFDPLLNGQTIVLTSGELVIRTNVTILGPGATNLAISGNLSSRVFVINTNAICTLAGLSIINGNGLGSIIANQGGGILNAGTLTVSNCTLTGNSSASFGGGIGNRSGTLTVLNSTLNGNSTSDAGGGIGNDNTGGTLAVNNCTLSGNSAFRGGGIDNFSTLTLQNSTLSGNRASSPAGGLGANGTERLTNCIVAGNFVGTTPSEIGGFVDSAAYNLIGSTNGVVGITHGVNGNLVGNAGVGTLAITSVLDTNLAFNGGSTRTHALVFGSPALNAGTNVAGLPTYDQRGPGFPRVAEGRVDIGAFELSCGDQGGPPYFGDVDADGLTFLDDFATLRANFGATGVGRASGDLDGNGAVGVADFNALRNNFGHAAAQCFATFTPPAGIPFAGYSGLSLRLLLDGTVEIVNLGANPVALSGYSLFASNSVLNPGDWRSLNALAGTNVTYLTNALGARAAFFNPANPTSQLLSELNLDGVATFPPGFALELGRPYAGSINVTNDVRFFYVQDGVVREGAVNRAPVAIPDDSRSLRAGDSCTADLFPDRLNFQSFDFDGDPLTYGVTPPGSYPIGSTPAFFWAIDNKGASNGTSILISVVDDAPPRFTNCPSAAIVVTTPPGSNTAQVFFDVGAADSCSTNVTVSCNPASGSYFPIGETEVRCTASAPGGTDECRFAVVVELGISLPTLVCPGNVTATNALGQCGAVVDFAITSDSAVTCVPSSGSFFTVGETPVSCTASNLAGVSTCSFTVTVLDKEAPVMTCPPDQAFTTPPGRNNVVVNFTPTATDNCGGNVNVICTPPSGSAFAVGTNTVLCSTVDAAGNSNSCSFALTVTAVPAFVEAPGVALTGVSDGALAWADFNGDGRPDLFVSGEAVNVAQRITQLQTNVGGLGLSNLNLTLPRLHLNGAAWADYDLDGDLDLLVSGEANGEVTQLWRNDGRGTFNRVDSGLPNLSLSSVAWGDYDHDGRPDLILSGLLAGETYVTRVYRNCGDDHFTDVGADLPGVLLGAAAWADFDRDGNLDLALMGFDGVEDIAKIYRGHGDGTFTEVSVLGYGFSEGAVAWGDYNNDGYPDVVFTGQSTTQARTVLYRNEPDGSGGRQFVAVENSRLPDLKQSAVAWGDFNNDGRLDVVIGGGTPLANPARLAGVYLNTGSDQFQAVAANLPAVERAMVACADFNGDGKLDIVMAGYTGTNKLTRVLLNDNALTNTPPTAPDHLTASLTTNGVVLQWNTATDVQTPAAGLNYNVRISGPNGRAYVLSPASLNDGTRLLPGAGNAGSSNAWWLGHLALPTGDYTWNVQAIDSAFAGSAFSADGTFHIEQPVFTQHAPDGLGAYVLRFTGSNQTYHVEATADLIDCGLSVWTRLGEARTNAPGEFEFLDLDNLSHPRRFYRLVWP